MSSHLDQINTLSADVSKESLEAMLALLEDETLTDEEFDAAHEAFEAMTYLYAFPENDEEERDAQLTKLIAKRLDLLQDLTFELYREEAYLDEAKLETEVAARLYEQAPAEQKEDRETDVQAMNIMMEQVTDEIVSIEQEITEAKAWIECAREMLVTEKFRTMPEECIEVLYAEDEEDFDEEDGYEEEEECGCAECSGDCEECDDCEDCDCEGEEDGGCCGSGECCKE